MNFGLIIVGDEILSGRTQDKNVAQLATWLNVQGIRLGEVRVVADDAVAIGAAVTTLAAAHATLQRAGVRVIAVAALAATPHEPNARSAG